MPRRNTIHIGNSDRGGIRDQRSIRGRVERNVKKNENKCAVDALNIEEFLWGK